MLESCWKCWKASTTPAHLSLVTNIRFPVDDKCDTNKDILEFHKLLYKLPNHPCGFRFISMCGSITAHGKSFTLWNGPSCEMMEGQPVWYDWPSKCELELNKLFVTICCNSGPRAILSWFKMSFIGFDFHDFFVGSKYNDPVHWRESPGLCAFAAQCCRCRSPSPALCCFSLSRIFCLWDTLCTQTLVLCSQEDRTWQNSDWHICRHDYGTWDSEELWLGREYTFPVVWGFCLVHLQNDFKAVWKVLYLNR